MQTAYYKVYAQIQRSHWWYLARAEILRTILSTHLQRSRERRLLDLGCGPGGMRSMLSEFGTLVSTDFTFDALHFCLDQHLDFLAAADATRLPFVDRSFGVACAFDVIEHIRNDSSAIREIHRVLVPSGLLILTVPAFQFLWGRQDIVNQHWRRYRGKQLRELLAGSGFQIIKLSYFNFFLFPPIAGVRLTYRALGLNRGLAPNEVKSDFTLAGGEGLNEALRRLFVAEKSLLRRMNLPFGVSLLCVAQKVAASSPHSGAKM